MSRKKMSHWPFVSLATRFVGSRVEDYVAAAAVDVPAATVLIPLATAAHAGPGGGVAHQVAEKHVSAPVGIPRHKVAGAGCKDHIAAVGVDGRPVARRRCPRRRRCSHSPAPSYRPNGRARRCRSCRSNRRDQIGGKRVEGHVAAIAADSGRSAVAAPRTPLPFTLTRSIMLAKATPGSSEHQKQRQDYDNGRPVLHGFSLQWPVGAPSSTSLYRCRL